LTSVIGNIQIVTENPAVIFQPDEWRFDRSRQVNVGKVEERHPDLLELRIEGDEKHHDERGSDEQPGQPAGTNALSQAFQQTYATGRRWGARNRRHKSLFDIKTQDKADRCLPRPVLSLT
jgi:hypothetical protein